MSDRSANANKEFICSYEFDGGKWCVTLWASTFEEAEMKLRAISAGKVDGILGGEAAYVGKCPTRGQDVNDDPWKK